MSKIDIEALQRARSAKNEAIKLINSEQELVSLFLENSVGLYVKQKNNEHTEVSTNEEMKADVKKDLVGLLDGLKQDAKNLDGKKVSTLVDTLKNNLDTYVDKMDTDLSAARDQILLKDNVKNIDPIKRDEATLKAASRSDFIETAKQLKDPEVTVKDTGWKSVANLFKKVGITTLATFFEKKNEEAKMTKLANIALQKLPNLKKQISIAEDKNRTPSPTPTRKDNKRGADIAKVDASR